MNNFQIKKFLAPTDILPITIVIGGILLALFTDLTAFRLIGTGISIIGVISLFMIISQRMSEYIDTRYKSKTPPPNFNITTKKDTNAKRQTFEDFVDSMKEEDKKEIKESEFSNSIQNADQGFRVIKKDEDKPVENEKEKYIAKSNEEKIVVKVEQSKMVFDDDDDIPDMPENFTPIRKDAIQKDNKPKDSVKPEVKAPKVDKSKKTTPVEVKEKETSEKKEVKVQTETRKIEGLSADFLKQDPIDNLSDPKHEFEYCINRILSAIKSVGSIGTTALFMVNHNANEYKLEAFSTNFPSDKITNKKKFAFRTDIISQIINNSKPEILSEINPNSELELITYYVDKIGISSFIGVPIYYREDIIGVLTADSEFTDGFDASTVNYFSHFTRLIAILIHNYVEKYDLSQSQKTLDALNKFRVTNYNQENSDLTYDLFSTVLELTTISFGGVVTWDNNKGNWNINQFVPELENVSELEIAPNSLVLNCIDNNNAIYKKSFDENEFIFNPKEEFSEFKKLVLLPIHCSGVIYGCLIVATDSFEELSDTDLDILEMLCDYTGSAYEKMQLISVLNENSYVDNETGLLNDLAYQQRIFEEYNRSLEFKRDISLCLINIDKYSAYEDDKLDEKMELMYFNTLKIINKLKRKYDIVAKNKKGYFCIIMPETKIETAKFWAEKLRNEIATSILEINQKKFNQTISVGISSISNSDNLSEFAENADIALKHSIEKTNTVTIFN
jgi:diguanylate cyclase (GGDEF)-like protein